MDAKVAAGAVTDTVRIDGQVMVGPSLGRAAALSQEGAKLVGFFLDPVALVALVFGLWRLGADLGWTGSFVIAEGLFSHWQVWIALAIGIKATQSLLRPSPRKPI